MWPIQLAFRFLISCRIFLCSLTLSNRSSFLIWSVQLIFSILLQHHISKLSRYFWSAARSVQVSALYKAMLQSLDTIKVFYLPTDAQYSCFKRILKFKLKQLLHFWVQSPSSGSLIPNSAPHTHINTDLTKYAATPPNQPQRCILNDYFNTVTLASSNNTFPDDGNWTKTCRSCFNVNFNILLKQLNCASVGKKKDFDTSTHT